MCAAVCEEGAVESVCPGKRSRTLSCFVRRAVVGHGRRDLRGGEAEEVLIRRIESQSRADAGDEHSFERAVLPSAGTSLYGCVTGRMTARSSTCSSAVRSLLLLGTPPPRDPPAAR